MKIFKDIFGRIWAVWGALLFISTMFILFIPFLLFYLFPEPRRTMLFISFSRVWMGIFLPGIGAPLRVLGKQHFKSGENYIVVCNHNSLMDVPVTSPAIPGGNKTIAKNEMARVPFFGIIYRLGSVLVDRKSEKSRRESYLKMKEVLEMGLHMCIYPEGTRNKTSEPLKSFHDGAFRLAIDTGKAIIPGLVFNTRKVMPSEKVFFLWPHKLELHFLEAVTIGKEETVQSLREKVFGIMTSYLLAHKH